MEALGSSSGVSIYKVSRISGILAAVCIGPLKLADLVIENLAGG